jgi:hypothetical protein
METMMKKDTSAWMIQVWVAFGISFAAATYGVIRLNLDVWPKAFMILGILASIAGAFTLSKTIRDNQHHQRDTHAWILQSWISFAVFILMTLGGLWNITADWNTKAYLFVSFLFALSSTFTLSKTVRDNDGTGDSNAQSTNNTNTNVKNSLI